MSTAVWPFWTASTPAMSKKFALPTNCVAGDWSSSSQLQKSWFRCKRHVIPNQSSLKIPSRMLPVSPPTPTISGQPSKLPATKVIKIKLFPTTEQRQTLNRWFNTARWTYNHAVQAIRDGTPRDRKVLRTKCVHNKLFATENRWVKQTPFAILDSAMIDVLQAYQTSIAAKRRKFTVNFKSCKAASDSIVIGSRYWKSGVFFPRCFGKIPLRWVEPIPAELDYNCRLQQTPTGNFYLCIPKPLDVWSKNQAPKDKLIALDPGVRTFQTGFTDNSKIMELGKKDTEKVFSLCRHLDQLQSGWSQPGGRYRSRYRLRKAAKGMQTRIQDLVHDSHHKVVKYLCVNFTTVLLPLFETRNMVSRIKRRIRSKMARAMLTWSHYRFCQCLLDKAREYPWCRVIIVNKAYTSKTCTNCGELHRNFGGSKTFCCPECRVVLDRNANGARNILLEFLTEHEMAGAIRQWVLAPLGKHSLAGLRVCVV